MTHAFSIGRDGVEDVCHHCQRGFRRLRGAASICPLCGVENVRPETTMLAPAAEHAIMPRGKARRARAKKVK